MVFFFFLLFFLITFVLVKLKKPLSHRKLIMHINMINITKKIKMQKGQINPLYNTVHAPKKYLRCEMEKNCLFFCKITKKLCSTSNCLQYNLSPFL